MKCTQNKQKSKPLQTITIWDRIHIFQKNYEAKKRSVWVMSWLKNRLETGELNNVLNLLKTEKTYVCFLQLLRLYLLFEFF